MLHYSHCLWAIFYSVKLRILHFAFPSGLSYSNHNILLENKIYYICVFYFERLLYLYTYVVI